MTCPTCGRWVLASEWGVLFHEGVHGCPPSGAD